MDKHTKINIPNSFKDIQEHCNDSLQLSIARPDELSVLAGEIEEPANKALIACYILHMKIHTDEQSVDLHCAVGLDQHGYRSTSPIVFIDLGRKRIRTYSGGIYGFTEIRTNDPDELTISICGTLNNYGLSDAAGVPPVFF